MSGYTDKTKEEIILENLSDKIEEIRGTVKDMDKRMETSYMTKTQFEAEFQPVKNIVYGMVATILLGVITAILALILR